MKVLCFDLKKNVNSMSFGLCCPRICDAKKAWKNKRYWQHWLSTTKTKFLPVCNLFSFASVVILSVPIMCFCWIFDLGIRKTQALPRKSILSTVTVSEGYNRQASSPENVYFLPQAICFHWSTKGIPAFIHRVFRGRWGTTCLVSWTNRGQNHTIELCFSAILCTFLQIEENHCCCFVGRFFPTKKIWSAVSGTKIPSAPLLDAQEVMPEVLSKRLLWIKPCRTDLLVATKLGIFH